MANYQKLTGHLMFGAMCPRWECCEHFKPHTFRYLKPKDIPCYSCIHSTMEHKNPLSTEDNFLKKTP